MSEISTKPYLLRAIYDWCTDQGYTPHITVVVDGYAQVPQEHVKNGEIVLNVGALATNRLQIGNELIEFQARFGGVARSIVVPVNNVSAIYARETGQGMAFEVTLNPQPPIEKSEQSALIALKAVTNQVKNSESAEPAAAPQSEIKLEHRADDAPKSPTDGGNRPKLTRIK